ESRGGRKKPMRSPGYESLQRFAVGVVDFLTEAYKQYALDRGLGFEEGLDLAHGNLRGPVDGKTVRTRADRGEGEGREAVSHEQRQGIAIALHQQLVLILVATMPDRADRVNDVLRGQLVASRDPGLARRAAAQRPALGEQLG